MATTMTNKVQTADPKNNKGLDCSQFWGLA